jgi:hypothetical protein
MKNLKVIKYYRRRNYGAEHEYVADRGDALILQRLTGQKTINGVIRELVRDLTGGLVGFEEVIAP